MLQVKSFTKIISIFLTACIVTTTLSVYSFALDDENSLSSDEFLKIAGELVCDYDTPFYTPESTEEFVIEECNRLIVKTVTNKFLKDDRNAIAKVEGWNSIHILQYSSAQETNEALEFFSSQPFVKYVEEDQYIEFIPCSSNDDIYLEEPLSWGNDVVKSITANEAILKSNIELNEVVVGVFDTGIATNHNYFSGNRLKEGYNVFEQNTNINDTQGHGSHVTGIILNNTLSNVKIKMYKLNSSTFFYQQTPISLFATAVISAVKDVDVINMSISIEKESHYIDEAIDYAYTNNVPIVVAAGNDLYGEGENADETYLASKDTVLAVAAIDESLTPMLKSKNGKGSTNYGTCIDIAAPGENINSVNYLLGFMSDSGTSMAAPFVTAAIATLKSIQPNISCEQVFELVKTKATVPNDWNSLYGTGILNVENMLSEMVSVSPKIAFNNSFDVTLNSSSKDAVIYYTIDDSDPIVGESNVYTSPIDTSNAITIKAVAYEKGKLPSAISSFRIKWDEDITIRYKGTSELLLPPNRKIVSCYSSNEEIVTVDKNEQTVYGVSVGEAKVIVNLETGQRITYNITVEYKSWQLFIICLLFGFLWYI